MEARFPSPITCPVVIGRVKELTTLRLLVDRRASGEAQVVLVSGEAGIGKSRLVAEAKASAAAHGFLLLEGQCFQTDGTSLCSRVKYHLLTSYEQVAQSEAEARDSPQKSDSVDCRPQRYLLSEPAPYQFAEQFIKLIECLVGEILRQFTELTFLPYFVQVLIQSIVAVSITSKGRCWDAAPFIDAKDFLIVFHNIKWFPYASWEREASGSLDTVKKGSFSLTAGKVRSFCVVGVIFCNRRAAAGYPRLIRVT
jgi:hypothetical protein